MSPRGFPLGSFALGLVLSVAVIAARFGFYDRRWHWAYLVGMAFALTFMMVPAVRQYALWRGVLDVPAARKVHLVATPLLGGVAVFGGFAVTVLENFEFSRELKGVAVGGAIVVAVGVLDDIVDVRAWWKLAAQLVAAGVAIVYGVHLDLVPNWLPGYAVGNTIITVVWFVAVTNAFQFLDGMDGLAAGLGGICAAFFAVAALETGQPYLMFLSTALVGACLGFLPYNFRPGGATIFLGDSGASFVGFTLAGLAVMGDWSDDSPVVAMFTPLLILGVPLFDIAFVGIARIVTGKVHSVGEWLAYTGKDHLHHRFAALGLTKTATVLLIFFISLTLGLSATVLKDSSPRERGLALLEAACVLAIIAILEGVARAKPEP